MCRPGKIHPLVGGRVVVKVLRYVAQELRRMKFVEPDHIFCDFEDFFAERFWREHLDLVAVAEYPPGDFPDAVHAKFYSG